MWIILPPSYGDILFLVYPAMEIGELSVFGSITDPNSTNPERKSRWRNFRSELTSLRLLD